MIRNDLKAWHNGDNLVAAVAAKNKNTIVVVHSVGQIIVEPWIDHANGVSRCTFASHARTNFSHKTSYCRVSLTTYIWACDY